MNDKNSDNKKEVKQLTIFDYAENYLSKKYDIRKNIVSNDFEIKLKKETNYKQLNENNLYIELQKNGIAITENKLIAILKSDYVSSYNPFADYFNNLPKYDKKKDFITILAAHIETNDQGRFYNHFTKWLVRVVKCALVDDYYNKNAFILVQNKQNSGKTTFCRFLCPPTLSDYIKENISPDKDGLISITKNILINLDELATLTRWDINNLKTILSKDKVNERLPYDKKNSIIPRRCSFIGSTNNSEFLTDLTGSVRWLCFEVQKINFDYKKDIDINKVWAQAYYLFKTGFNCELTKQEIEENETKNEAHLITPPEMEIIQQKYKPASKENHKAFYTANDFIKNIQEDNRFLKLNNVNVGRILSKLGFVKDSKFNGTYPVKGYYIDFIEKAN